MGQAMTDAQDNRSHLEEQFSQTQNMLAAFGNKISDVGQRTNLSRKLLDDMCGEGNEGVKELRRKLRDLELTSLRGNPQWIQEACEEDEQVCRSSSCGLHHYFCIRDRWQCFVNL